MQNAIIKIAAGAINRYAVLSRLFSIDMFFIFSSCGHDTALPSNSDATLPDFDKKWGYRIIPASPRLLSPNRTVYIGSIIIVSNIIL